MLSGMDCAKGHNPIPGINALPDDWLALFTEVSPKPATPAERSSGRTGRKPVRAVQVAGYGCGSIGKAVFGQPSSW